MKNTKILIILALALSITVCSARVSEAAPPPFGTAFTYQGRLIDANGPADDFYDFEFKLFDDPYTDTQQGSTIEANDVDVIDGYFTVELDFGSGIFTGVWCWLEIAVRPGESVDPKDFVTLRPRQEITPTPYAINADLLDGSDSSDFASASHNHDSRYYTEAESDSRFVNVTGDSMSASSDSWILSVENTGGGIGVYGKATGVAGRGVYGEATNEGNVFNYGGTFIALGGRGKGVYGAAVNEEGSESYGGYFETAGSEGRGVYGEATNMGAYTNYGGYFKAMGENGIGVYGAATLTGDWVNYGGYFEAWGSQARAVYGKAGHTGAETSYGGYFMAVSGAGRGVYGKALGISGMGVFGEATGTNGRGVYGYASGSNGIGVYGQGTGGAKAGYFGGDVHTTGEITKAFTTGTSNLAAPIAYAFINSNGTVASGTPNVSCTWNAAQNRYEITIAGESYYYNDYVTTVTVSSGSARFTTTGSVSGKLLITIWDLSGSKQDVAFQFVTYKP